MITGINYVFLLKGPMANRLFGTSLKYGQTVKSFSIRRLIPLANNKCKRRKTHFWTYQQRVTTLMKVVDFSIVKKAVGESESDEVTSVFEINSSYNPYLHQLTGLALFF